MKRFMIYYEGYKEYIANSEEEARQMFENDHFGGYEMDVEEVEEIEEDD